MRVLAIDTSGAPVSVAIVTDGRLDARFFVRKGRHHSEQLMPLVQNCLDAAGVAAGAFDVYAAVTGPGSFTGVRIGVATVKAMAYAAGARVVGVPSLEALAYGARCYGADLTAPALDARNGQVYAAIYNRIDIDVGAGLASPACLPPSAMHHTEFASKLIECVQTWRDANGSSQPPVRVLLLGGGEAPVVEALQPLAAEGVVSILLADAAHNAPDAAHAALLAHERALRGQSIDPNDLLPLYLRPSQAERLRASRNHA